MCIMLYSSTAVCVSCTCISIGCWATICTLLAESGALEDCCMLRLPGPRPMLGVHSAVNAVHLHERGRRAPFMFIRCTPVVHEKEWHTGSESRLTIRSPRPQ